MDVGTRLLTKCMEGNTYNGMGSNTGTEKLEGNKGGESMQVPAKHRKKKRGLLVKLLHGCSCRAIAQIRCWIGDLRC